MDDKVDLKSLDMQKDKIEQLKKAFPEVVTEGKVDFEKLKAELGEEVEIGKERYEMKWPGKANLQKIIQEPSIGTLKPAKEASIDFDTTENLFIEGDSLEVLKLLQKSYYGKIKMIYIDPPYNTGKDFIYPDNYTESLDTYLRYTGQKGEKGLKLTTNAETEGRYHSKWMNMMYPRLFLARNLLKEDGVIFISIDDHEVDNLKKICNEIFGEESFVGIIKRRAARKTANLSNEMSDMCDYIMVYVKGELGNPLSVEGVKDDTRPVFNNGNSITERLIRTNTEAKCEDEIYRKGRYEVRSLAFELLDDLSIVNGKTTNEVRVKGPFRINQDTLDKTLYITRNFGLRRYVLDEEKDQAKAMHDLIDDAEFYNEKGTEELMDLFNHKDLFNNPKPMELIKYLAVATKASDGSDSNNDFIVIDFFAGSATTAHAVLDLNKVDGGNRKFIMVQLQEPTTEDSEAKKAGFDNIAQIGEERIRRVIKKIKEENEGKFDFDSKKMDLGFKVLRLSESNFKIWDKKSDAPIQQQLQLSVSNVNDDSSDEAFLYEIILKSGFELSVKVEELSIQGKKVYSVDDKSLLICLENNLTQEFIKEVAGLEGQRVVFLDRGFDGNDQLKTNTVELMKAKGVEFKTV